MAIERPEGVLVDALPEAGLAVLAIHPDQVRAAGPRCRMAGSPDGSGAFVLAELARTDADRLRVLRPDSDEERLSAAPVGRVGEAEARRTIVLGPVRAPVALVEGIRPHTSQIADAVGAHPDGALFGSYPSAQALAGDVAGAPVAIESGRPREAGFRRACGTRLRAAPGVLADAGRHHNPWTPARHGGLTRPLAKAQPALPRTA